MINLVDASLTQFPEYPRLGDAIPRIVPQSLRARIGAVNARRSLYTPAVSGAAGASLLEDTVATFVLVHGAGGGSISWRHLTPLLCGRGHDVYAPSLTGLGERLHLGGPATNLSTHVQDIVGILEFEDLTDVLLVGHSYGGMVITGVADRVPERIAHLVYLDGLLPISGQSCLDMEGGADLASMPLKDGWLLLFPEQSGVPRPPSPGHPIGTLNEKLELSRPLEERAFSRTYVKAAGHPPVPVEERRDNFWNAAERVRFDPAWRYAELPAGHGLHREAPEAVVGLLLDLASSTGG